MNWHEQRTIKVTAYTLPLNEGLVRAFIAFAELRIRFGRALKKGELGLSNSQYANFQNLRHFKIIAQWESGKQWEMTSLGWRFYFGEEALLTPSAHLAGQTLLDDHPAWQTHAAGRKLVTIYDVAPKGWKQREEFQQEKLGIA